jgi:hypothetical protein
VSRVSTGLESLMAISSTLTALQYRQSDLVSVADWQQSSMTDAGLSSSGESRPRRWIETAEALFGLHDPPKQPGPSYRRLGRYDVIGLVWLLHGRPIVALTADRAVIGRADGPIFYDAHRRSR